MFHPLAKYVEIELDILLQVVAANKVVYAALCWYWFFLKKNIRFVAFAKLLAVIVSCLCVMSIHI